MSLAAFAGESYFVVAAIKAPLTFKGFRLQYYISTELTATSEVTNSL